MLLAYPPRISSLRNYRRKAFVYTSSSLVQPLATGSITALWIFPRDLNLVCPCGLFMSQDQLRPGHRKGPNSF